MAERDVNDDDAYEILRLESMSARQTVEDYCEAFLARPSRPAPEFPTSAERARN